MRVILAGYNLDTETIRELRDFIHEVVVRLEKDRFQPLSPDLKQKILDELYISALSLLERNNLTPETLSAAYARISRNPKPVNELREIARQEVDRARKSNQNIIFGLGHSSVAEHAVFNFDIIDVSRLAVETIEHFRLASYTEKSQRYILFEDDFIIPEELKNSPLLESYIQLIREQNSAYHRIYHRLRPYFFEKFSEAAKDIKNHSRLDGLAKEDARYVISLATYTQLGMTVNARSLEHMISRCSAHPLAEVKEYARNLYNVTRNLAPSLIKYVEPTPYLSDKNRHLQEFIHQHFEFDTAPAQSKEAEVQLIDYPENLDEKILAAVLFHNQFASYSEAVNKICSLSKVEKREFFKKIFQDINPWDSVLREFEFAHLTFQLIVSASNYGQLKRHRMVHIIPQNYNLDLGVVLPESISETHQESTFVEIIEKTNELYNTIQKTQPYAASYLLTNAHRRRVLLKINLRELYHFSRLREDEHAQWDIRNIARKMHELISQKCPIAGELLGGKDIFNERYQNFFSR
ncbi:MAG: hypothetical protein Kow0042_25590 [Calditrichia bacterium]